MTHVHGFHPQLNTISTLEKTHNFFLSFNQFGLRFKVLVKPAAKLLSPCLGVRLLSFIKSGFKTPLHNSPLPTTAGKKNNISFGEVGLTFPPRCQRITSPEQL